VGAFAREWLSVSVDSEPGATVIKPRQATSWRLFVLIGALLAGFALSLPFDAPISNWFQWSIPESTWQHRVVKLSRWPFIWQVYVVVGILLQIEAVRAQRETARAQGAAPPRGLEVLAPAPRVIGYIVACAACFGLLHLVKFIVGRARPDKYVGPYVFDLFGDPGGMFDSMPSAHTSAAVLLTALLFRYEPRTGWVLIPLTVLASLSRVVQGRHFLSDVMAGAAFTLLIAYACMKILGPRFYEPLAGRGEDAPQARVSARR
jgi:membrane-associated phospholipid phosphatase